MKSKKLNFSIIIIIILIILLLIYNNYYLTRNNKYTILEKFKEKKYLCNENDVYVDDSVNAKENNCGYQKEFICVDDKYKPINGTCPLNYINNDGYCEPDPNDMKQIPKQNYETETLSPHYPCTKPFKDTVSNTEQTFECNTDEGNDDDKGKYKAIKNSLGYYIICPTCFTKTNDIDHSKGYLVPGYENPSVKHKTQQYCIPVSA